MSSDWVSDVRPAVREGVRALLEAVTIDEPEMPARTFHRLTDDPFFENTASFPVETPGEYFTADDRFDDVYAGEFGEAARAVYEALPGPGGVDADQRAKRIVAIERALFEFTGIVADYAGAVRFDADAFAAAFAEQFEPRYTDRRRARYLLCLQNTAIEPGVSIDLETDLQGKPAYLGPYGIDTLRIRPLGDLEETGIATYEAPSTGVLERVEPLSPSRPNPVVELVLERRRPLRDITAEIDDTDRSPWRTPSFDVTPVDQYPWQRLTEVVRYVATCVRRCLRLEYPAGVVGFDRGYHVRPGWETYRGIATPVTFALDFDAPTASVGTRLREDRTPAIERLWRTHRQRFRPDDSAFQNPLSRFERMFDRDRVEDQLVDCVVGCEATLLKGGSPGGNRYRLGLRAAALIGDRNAQEWSATQVGAFFRTLYQWRNVVVHEDRSLPNDPGRDDRIEVGERAFLADELLPIARECYADVLRAYLDRTASLECSIDTINERIDDRLLERAPTVRAALDRPAE
ncbi:hypothetical protein [Halopiger djelfimassiliensis]|uniref:hypothetical protein n=1 Tax=Halopiger djelfimassiliensis TaxID=1293047 RepID=UPI000677C0CE|nr:hypothetical protein [Halopiger djelfimassiliensis]